MRNASVWRRGRVWLLGLAGLAGCFGAGAPAAELLGNGDLAIRGEAKTPAGWFAAAKTNPGVNDPENKTPAGKVPLKIAITQDFNAVGYVGQTAALSKPGQNLVFTGALKSSAEKTAYYEVRLLEKGKMIQQQSSEVSGTEWKTVTVKIASGQADAVQVFCRYQEKAGAVGGTVWFAGTSLTSDQRQISLALVGDSTVASYKPEQKLCGWGQVLPRFFRPEVLIRNAAVPGTSTKTFPEKDRWVNVLTGRPTYVLIQFGHNDAHDKSKPESTDPATTYRENLRKYVAEAREAGATPVLVTPMHRRLFQDGKISLELEPYAAAMREVAAETKTPLIDLHALSGEAFGKLGEEGSLPYFASAADRSHFSEKGALLLAELVAQELRNQFPELAAVSMPGGAEATPAAPIAPAGAATR